MQPQGDIHQALDRFLERVVMYKCTERDARTSKSWINQAMCDSLYKERLADKRLYFTGSRFEGMPAEVCGDWDIMVNQRSYPVVRQRDFAKPTQDPNFPTGHVRAEGNHDNPAYLNLTLTPDMTFQSDDISKSVTTHNNIQHLSSALFVSQSASPDIGCIEHGPATTTSAFHSNPEWGVLDKVPCLVCDSWPLGTEQFFTRPRSRDWPPPSLLRHIKKAGCQVVGVGHHCTEKRNLEWRLSFSVAERELIWHMDTSTFCSMFVLKAIKNQIWRATLSTTALRAGAVCSYYIKVACLWVAELYEHTGIMATVGNVLDWLIMCYENNKLPHYFIPEQNLIGHLPKDECREVASVLNSAKSQLRLHILCGLRIDMCLPGVLQHIRNQLHFTPEDHPTSENHRQFLTILLNVVGRDRQSAIKALEEATRSVNSDSDTYAQSEHYWVGCRAAAHYMAVYITLSEHIHTQPASELVAIPETILLPIIEKLSSGIKPNCVDTFRSSLYRHLAEIYHSLYTFLRQDYNQGLADTLEGEILECYKKSETYNIKGLTITYPDRWTDMGISGLVNMARFYYLNGEWEKAESAMADLLPLLEEFGNSPEIVNGSPCMIIDNRYELCKHPWKGDMDLYCPLVERWTSTFAIVNPIMLGYYIRGKLALRQGRRSPAEESIRGMKQAMTFSCMWRAEQRETTSVLINVLNSHLTEHDKPKRVVGSDEDHKVMGHILSSAKCRCCLLQ